MSDSMTFLSAVTGGLIAGAASYVATKQMFEEQRYSDAVKQFYESVNTEMIKYDEFTFGNRTIGDLKNSLAAVDLAMVNFIPYVQPQKSWKQVDGAFDLFRQKITEMDDNLLITDFENDRQMVEIFQRIVTDMVSLARKPRVRYLDIIQFQIQRLRDWLKK